MGDVAELEDYRPVWRTVKETCAECGSHCVGVVHRDSDLTSLECGRCGKMTSAVTHVWCDDHGFTIEHPREPA